MNRTIAGALGVGLSFVLSTSPIDAQTVSTGPYYAIPSWDQKLPATTRFVVLSKFTPAGRVADGIEGEPLRPREGAVQ